VRKLITYDDTVRSGAILGVAYCYHWFVFVFEILWRLFLSDSFFKDDLSSRDQNEFTFQDSQ